MLSAFLGLLAALLSILPTNLPPHLVEHSIDEHINLIPAVSVLFDNLLDLPLRNFRYLPCAHAQAVLFLFDTLQIAR